MVPTQQQKELSYVEILQLLAKFETEHGTSAQK